MSRVQCYLMKNASCRFEGVLKYIPSIYSPSNDINCYSHRIEIDRV